MSARIYHNPACATSRNVLALLRAAGEEPEVVEYLKTPPGRDDLHELIAGMGGSSRDLRAEGNKRFFFREKRTKKASSVGVYDEPAHAFHEQ